MTKLTTYLCAALMIIGLNTACNSDSGDYEEYNDSSEYAVMITSFKLAANDEVLTNLDSVFFSIDLNKAVVFNADSLPKGTDVNKLQVSMTFSTGVSKASITMPGVNVQDTVVNYLTNADAPINFSVGEVSLDLVSANGATARTYTLKVNVHNMKPDSLCWGNEAYGVLPTPFDVVKAQKTVAYGEELVTFATDGTAVSRASSADPASKHWSVDNVTLPSGAEIGSITVCDDELFIVADNKLFISADKGSTWSDTGVAMTHIYGAVDSQVVGVTKDDSGAYSHVSYPANTVKPFSDVQLALMPVSGSGQPMQFSSDWSSQAQLIFVGGRKADGTLSGDTWAYDGTDWAMLAADSAPAAEGLTMVPYYRFKINNQWQATRYSVLLLFGGNTADGTPIDKVYVSNDMALHWSQASRQMQFPETLTPGAFAQAYVMESTIRSRAVSPIDSWQCPYIYLFGGVNADGTLSDSIWRGVLNRLSFKPLQ